MVQHYGIFYGCVGFAGGSEGCSSSERPTTALTHTTSTFEASEKNTRATRQANPSLGTHTHKKRSAPGWWPRALAIMDFIRH